jgi:SOS-response transcriptional repressor LexA
MEPTLRAGDLLWVQYGVVPVPGQMVVARFADGTLAVKRAAERRESGWWLLSDNPEAGVDSRHRGAVPEGAIVAVVRARLPRSRLCARLRRCLPSTPPRSP